MFSSLRHFDMTKYFGIWYQIERNHSFPGLGGKCWTQTYYPDAHVAGKSKLRMEYHDFLINNKLVTELEIYQLFRNDPATLTSTLFGLPITAEHYQVLSTDYTNYAVEWRCEERGIFQHRESLWILSRRPYPKPWILEEARSVVTELGLKVSKLKQVSQDCYLPSRTHQYSQPF